MLMQAVVTAVEEGPEPNDVVAGWGGFAIFMALVVAVALLGWSLTRQLRKAQKAEDEGVYGRDEPAEPGAQDEDTPDK